jgi:hypothetical protein
VSYSAPYAGDVGHLAIPSVGISAPIMTTGTLDGAMVIPGNVRWTAWLDQTAHFGDLAGSAVIGGHVASPVTGVPGVLAPLGRTPIGALIYWSIGGQTEVFRVVKIGNYQRSQPLPSWIFTVYGPPTLNVITCSQEVHYADGRVHWLADLVVTADRIR